MEPFTTLEAPAIPIDQPNLDTDQIIPARFLGRPRPTRLRRCSTTCATTPDRQAARRIRHSTGRATRARVSWSPSATSPAARRARPP